MLDAIRLAGGFRNLCFRYFCDDRLQSSCGLRAGLAHGGGRRRDGNWRAKTGKSFFRFLFPLRPAKTLGGSGVPAGRFQIRTDLFVDLSKFERNHGVACAFVQRRELSWGIRAGSRFTDARLNLSPITHEGSLYQPYARGASDTLEKTIRKVVACLVLEDREAPSRVLRKAAAESEP